MRSNRLRLNAPLPSNGAVHALTLMFFLLAICLFPSTTVGQAYVPPPPNVYVTPTVGPPTTTVFVSGNGFDPFAAVDIYFDTTDLLEAVRTRLAEFKAVTRLVTDCERAWRHAALNLEKSQRQRRRATLASPNARRAAGRPAPPASAPQFPPSPEPAPAAVQMPGAGPAHTPRE